MSIEQSGRSRLCCFACNETVPNSIEGIACISDHIPCPCWPQLMNASEVASTRVLSTQQPNCILSSTACSLLLSMQHCWLLVAVRKKMG